MNDLLKYEIEKMIARRDSTIRADTTVAPPPESFLLVLYKRKMKILKTLQHLDSMKMIEITEGNNP